MSDLNHFLFIVNLTVLALAGGFYLILPSLTRHSYLFGVRIPPEQQASLEARRIKGRYMRVCLLFIVAIALAEVTLYVMLPELMLMVLLYFPLLFVVMLLTAFIPSWRMALALKQRQDWQVPATTYAETRSAVSRETLRAVPWAWYITALLIALSCIIIGMVLYPTLPEQIPINLGFDMKATAWAPKSLLSVLMMPLSGLAITVGLGSIGVSINKARLQIDQQSPALSFAQHRLYRQLLGNAMGFLALGLVAMVALVFLAMMIPGFRVPFSLVIALIIVPAALLIAVLVRSGQGGYKLRPLIGIVEETSELMPRQAGLAGLTSAKADRSDDSFWKLGLFYFNQNDPAMIIEDRFGNNIGFNYARLPVQVSLSIGLLGLIGLYAYLTTLMLTLTMV